MSGDSTAIDAAFFRWASVGSDGATEATWFKIIPARSGGIRVLGYDMGPETERMTGHYDYAYWIDISASDLMLFTACMVGKLLGAEGSINFDQMKDACTDWGIPFVEGDGPYAKTLEDPI